MAGGFPIFGSIANIQNAITSQVLFINAGSGASANNTKTAYTQLIASTTYDANLIDLCVGAGAGAVVGFNAACDLAVGASGSEVPILSNLLLENDYDVAATGANSPHILLPLPVPAGTRLSMRCQVSASYNAAGTYVFVNSLDLFETGFAGNQFGAIDTIGFQSGSTIGTSVTASATANVKGSYAQLIASTSVDYIGYFLAYDYQSTTGGNELFRTDIAVGVSGSETVIHPNHYMTMSAGATQWMSPITPIYFNPIPAGSRIAARTACSTTGSKVLGVTLYGIR